MQYLSNMSIDCIYRTVWVWLHQRLLTTTAIKQTISYFRMAFLHPLPILQGRNERICTLQNQRMLVSEPGRLRLQCALSLTHTHTLRHTTQHVMHMLYLISTYSRMSVIWTSVIRKRWLTCRTSKFKAHLPPRFAVILYQELEETLAWEWRR